MKNYIIIFLVCGMAVAVADIIKRGRVIVEEVTVTRVNRPMPVIPVEVTLTKYQLQKMLRLVEDKHTDFDGRLAEPQDAMTFKSTARGGEKAYRISSTQLARYSGKIVPKDVHND